MTIPLKSTDEEITGIGRETSGAANDFGFEDVAVVAAVVDPEAAVARLVQGEGVSEGAPIGDGEADGDVRVVGVVGVVGVVVRGLGGRGSGSAVGVRVSWSAVGVEDGGIGGVGKLRNGCDGVDGR